MLVADVARRVRDAAGDTAVLQFTNETLTDWINDAVRTCVEDNSLLTVKANQNTVIGQADYALPNDIFKFHSVLVGGQKLEMLTREQWEERFSTIPVNTADNGRPTTCYVYAGVLTLSPAPDIVYTLQINYSKFPSVIAYGAGVWNPVGLSIPEQYHSRVVTYCLAQVAMQDDNYEKYQALMNEFKTGVVAMNDSRHEDDLYPSISISSRDMGYDYPYYPHL